MTAWCWVGGCAALIVIACGACQPAASSPARGGSAAPHAAGPLPRPGTSPAPEVLPLAGDALLPLPAGAQQAVVEHHTDGDTLAVRALAKGPVLSSTSQVTVRLPEIDTPETKMPGLPSQCYGPAASAELTRLAPLGSTVFAAADKDRVDRYGRQLLYLWDGQGRSINLALVVGGYAKAVLYAPNDRYIAVLRAAEAKAKATRKGLWGACPEASPTPSATPGPAPTRTQAAPSATRTATLRCDPSYPTVCIPPGPPDLNCRDIGYRRFRPGARPAAVLGQAVASLET
jgi:micrococcal nuclease